jgi:hypothetical protein
MSPDIGSPPGIGQWMTLSDALLSGLVHALNNRITALSVCAELAQLGDTQMITDGMLSGEVARLQRASALLGLLPSRGAEPEALEVRPMLDDVIALHAHHPRMRSIECLVESAGAQQPIRAPRWALLRLLVLLVDLAKTSAGEVGEASSVRLASDESALRLRVTTSGDVGPYGASMAELCGGTLAREGADLVLTLPSLLLLRQRARNEAGG